MEMLVRIYESLNCGILDVIELEQNVIFSKGNRVTNQNPTKECDCMSMKIAKIILSIITMLFAVLGLVKILPFDIANPIMLVSLATLLLLRSVEYKNNRDKGGFMMTCLTAVFVYVVVIYNVFIG